MDKTAFWQQKLIQFFHDPPAKPYILFSNSKWFKDLLDQIFVESNESGINDMGLTKWRSVKGHERIAAALFQAIIGESLRYVSKAPDWCSSGADRPMLYAKRKERSIHVYWPKQPLLTHPLAPNVRLDVGNPGDDGDPDKELIQRRETAHDLLESQMRAAAEGPLTKLDWGDAIGLQNGFVRLWRRFREDLIARRGVMGGIPGTDALWEEMPSDSRCPDHSIWDHLRVSTALAFLKPHRSDQRAWLENQWSEGAREPWMLRFSLGPVQSFIAEARTGRDLWTGSMILAELSWAAMLPFVEHYGPDSILYPDLRANPRADHWLYDHYPEALPRGSTTTLAARDISTERLPLNPSSFAALLPASFVVLIPRGGEGHLIDVESLASEVQTRVAARWSSMAVRVRSWLITNVGTGAWTEIWDRQLDKPPFYCIWTAVPWLPLGCIQDPDNLLGRALPAQREGFREPADPEGAARDRAVMQARAERLRPWVSPEIWSQYERARDTYARSRLDVHQLERGFDYALTHHQLTVRHRLRKGSYPMPASSLDEEHGEKCTQCGKRQALTNTHHQDTGLDQLRIGARQLWSDESLDPDKNGHERLCGVCALKRFLVTADQDLADLVFNRVWTGPSPNGLPSMQDRDRKLRVPFPSTATIASQVFIERLLSSMPMREQLGDLLISCQRARLERTSFPRSLPRLAALANNLDESTRLFLEYEPEDVLFPDALEGKAKSFEEKARRSASGTESDRSGEYVQRAEALRTLAGISRRLLKAARSKLGNPGTQIAVIRMDGDHMGRLLLGDPESIATRWRDVIHPDGVSQLMANQDLLKSGWADLLDAKRLMGPSLHAFISRALGHFSHRIVPWVVEMEFSGRLIYAGGDDLLCIAPADDALNLAARLQQLFSAAWVVDTDPLADPWAWRRPDWRLRYDPKSARQRFAIPIMPEPSSPEEDIPIRLPVDRPERLAVHVAEDPAEWQPRLPCNGSLLPMLGSGASLSAGIAFSHYKMPLGALLKRSMSLLDLAKESDPERAGSPKNKWTGRRALAVGHASRGGDKTTFVMPWKGAHDNLSAHRQLSQVIKAFSDGTLPSRLPYKLRERARSVSQALQSMALHANGEERLEDLEKHLLEGLLEACLDGARVSSQLSCAVLDVWRQGIHLKPSRPERFTDGLLFCRALARGGEAD